MTAPLCPAQHRAGSQQDVPWGHGRDIALLSQATKTPRLEQISTVKPTAAVRTGWGQRPSHGAKAPPESRVLPGTAVFDLQSSVTAVANRKYLSTVCSSFGLSSCHVINSVFFREGCGKFSPLPPLAMKHKS